MTLNHSPSYSYMEKKIINLRETPKKWIKNISQFRANTSNVQKERKKKEFFRWLT
jgi:hypothetical protein